MTPRSRPGRLRLRPLTAALSLLGLTSRLVASDASVQLSRQDNATNTTAAGGRLAAWMLTATAGEEGRQPLARDDALYFGAEATGHACLTYPRLDDLTAGPALALVHKFGLGAYAPLLRFEAAVAGIAARESYRTGWNGHLSLEWSRRFTDALQLACNGEWKRTDTRADVFSTTTTGVATDLTYDFTETWRAKIHLGWRNGKVVSYYRAYWTQWGWEPAGYYGSRGTYGSAGGELVQSFDEPYLAYRVRAHTWNAEATLSPAIGRDTALLLSYGLAQTENARVRYWNRVVSAGIVRRF